MILAAVDEFMLASRFSVAADRLGACLAFARTQEEALDRARHLSPSIVFVDLNADRLEPLTIVKLLKADPALRDIPVIGFVSHVQADRIALARAAGIDEVLARSVLIARLPDLMRQHGGASPATMPPPRARTED